MSKAPGLQGCCVEQGAGGQGWLLTEDRHSAKTPGLTAAEAYGKLKRFKTEDVWQRAVLKQKMPDHIMQINSMSWKYGHGEA
jgi:hypothetical protein